MFQKLKDGANKLKAKIGGDDLDEKLVQVVSQENWQASTQQLHEIANAAYNYEKWQRINQFIWDKLKKSKSWKKVLKTFNLIEFLLKNGPPSIISNFKYDLYQIRTFESYTNYVDGVDKGEPIRERAKVVTGLLGNEELLEEERVKAKNIREKMSNVVGGTAYGSGYGGSGSSNSGYGGSGSGSGNGYSGSGYSGSGSYGGSKQDSKKKGGDSSNSYNYGTGLGYFGDYGYNKSTLDKYKDAKNDKPTNDKEAGRKEEKKPDIVVETKKPFEKIAGKLSKPGQRKEVVAVEEVKTVGNTQASISGGNIIDIDILGGEPTKPQTSTPAFTFEQQPAVTQPPQQPTPVQQPFVQQPAVQQPVVQQPVQQPLYPQPQPPFNPYGQAPGQQPYGQAPGQQPFGQIPGQQPFGQPYGQPGYGQPQYPGQYGAPNPQFGGYNQYGQPQPQPQPQPYGYPQNPPAYGAGQGYPAQPGVSPYINPMYPTTAPLAVGQVQQKGSLNAGITLGVAKKDEDFGNFASSTGTGTAQNVAWLSNTEKGLIDFTDFGSEIKKESKAPGKEVSNNIQIDAWSW